MSNCILIIDIETTGFLKARGKIVEIGIVELDMRSGETKVLFDEVMHERPITKEEVESSWIVKNSDLTVEEIRKSKQLKDYFTEVQDILNKYPLGCTAFNNTFDFGFMEDRGFKFPKKLACPMKLATNVCKIPSKFGGRGYKWPNVEEAYKHLFGDTNYIEKHRGADDAMHEAEIVHELYLQGVFRL